MKIKRYLFFLVVILYVSSCKTIAIPNNEPLDNIVLITGDTLYGKVDYFKEGYALSEFYRKIRLTDTNGRKKRFKRKKVLSYKVNGYDYESFTLDEETRLVKNGRFFDSKYYIDQNSNQHFLKVISKGKLSHYELDGLNVKDLSKDELATIRNEKIGFIFQSYNLLARTSAIENVELPLLYSNKVSSAEQRERAIQALERVGLGHRLHHTPGQLSGGQQQRIAIARSLINNPVIILADEATGNLDTRNSYEIMALFQKLNKQGITIIFVTHEPDIASFSSRTIVLKDGLVIQDDKNSNILSAAEELAKLPKQDALL